MANENSKRQDANQEFANSSFLYGGNAGYIEELYAQYETDRNSVSQDWQDYFGSLKDERRDVLKNADGASWKKPNWPIHANGELVSAFDGDWSAVEKVVSEKIASKSVAKGSTLSNQDIQRAAKDSVSAIMMIRAYRMRGHLHANLDPLGIA
ncbi:MAG: 2-oxoglutarate dehydrogenase E1 component, partial [Salaquimonas sp.]